MRSTSPPDPPASSANSKTPIADDQERDEADDRARAEHRDQVDAPRRVARHPLAATRSGRQASHHAGPPTTSALMPPSRSVRGILVDERRAEGREQGVDDHAEAARGSDQRDRRDDESPGALRPRRAGREHPARDRPTRGRRPARPRSRRPAARGPRRRDRRRTARGARTIEHGPEREQRGRGRRADHDHQQDGGEGSGCRVRPLAEPVPPPDQRTHRAPHERLQHGREPVLRRDEHRGDRGERLGEERRQRADRAGRRDDEPVQRAELDRQVGKARAGAVAALRRMWRCHSHTTVHTIARGELARSPLPVDARGRPRTPATSWRRSARSATSRRGTAPRRATPARRGPRRAVAAATTTAPPASGAPMRVKASERASPASSSTITRPAPRTRSRRPLSPAAAIATSAKRMTKRMIRRTTVPAPPDDGRSAGRGSTSDITAASRSRRRAATARVSMSQVSPTFTRSEGLIALVLVRSERSRSVHGRDEHLDARGVIALGRS